MSAPAVRGIDVVRSRCVQEEAHVSGDAPGTAIASRSIVACVQAHEGVSMKRRELKFVAGALPLAPDRIARSLRKPPAGRRKNVGPTKNAGAAPGAGAAARKRR